MGSYSYSALRSSGLGAEKGILSLFSNKVLIFKIGQVPENKYQFFLTALEQAGHCVDVHDLATGLIRRLYFDFLNGDSFLTDLDEQFKLHVNWDQYYVHQRIVAAICICHCPSSLDLDIPFSEFSQLKKKLLVPGGPGHVKCFAFEPLESQEDHRSRLDFVLVPPNENIERVKGYLGTLIEDLGSHLLNDFHKYMRSYERMGLILKTPLENDNSNSNSNVKQAKLQKGRHSKHLGDLCLLIGNSKEASNYYQIAQDLTRVNSDWLWYAGAMQGFAAYLVLIEENNDIPKYIDRMDQLFQRILEALNKVPDSFFLSIDAVFHLARYAAKFKQFRLVTKTLEEVGKLRGDCGDHDQVALLMDAADICMQIGFHRKFAFYVNEAEWLYENLLQFSSAYALLNLVAPIYRLDHINNIVAPKGFSYSLPPPSDPLLPASPLPPRGWSRARLVENGYSVGRWVVLQKYILERLIATAKWHSDKALSASSCTYMLRALQPHLDRETQKSLAADLWSITANLPLNTSIDMTGMPMVLRLVPVINEQQSLIVQQLTSSFPQSEQQEGEDGHVFLFSPEDNEEEGGGFKKMTYVTDETLEVDVYLSNPFLFELVIQRITLSTSGVHFEPFPRSLTLPPRSIDMQVRLSGKPLAPGILQFKGVHIRAFNLTCEHLVDNSGCGVSTLRSSHPSDYRYMGFDIAPITEILPKIYPSRYPYTDVNKLSGNSNGNGGGSNNDGIQVKKKINCKECQVLTRLPRLVLRHPFIQQAGGKDSALLVGEERSIELFFENSGSSSSKLSIGYLKIDIQDQYALNSAERQAAYYSEEESFLIEQMIAKKKQQKELMLLAEEEKEGGGGDDSDENNLSDSEEEEEMLAVVIEREGGGIERGGGNISNRSRGSRSGSRLSSPAPSPRSFSAASLSSFPSTTTTITTTTIPILSIQPASAFLTATTTTITTIETASASDSSALFADMESLPSTTATQTAATHYNNHLEVKIDEQEENLMSVHFTRSNSDSFSVNQPALLPGQSLRVPIDIVGLDSCKSAIVSVTYAELPSSSIQRTFKQTVSWEVRPCLELKSLRALPPKGKKECQLLLEVQNSAATSFVVWCQLDGAVYPQPAAVEQNRVVRVSLPLDCMLLGPGSSHLRKLPSSPAALALSNQLLARCRAEFLRRVKLKWESADQRKGCLPLIDAHLTREFLVTLLPPPFAFTFVLPEQCVVVSSPTVSVLRDDPQYRMLLGSFEKVSMTITNTTPEPQTVELVILPYQDLNGRQDVDLGQKLLVVGSLRTSWPVIRPGQTILYDLNICFLSPGRFGFQFSVQYQETTESDLLEKKTQLTEACGWGSRAKSAMLKRKTGIEVRTEEDKLTYIAPCLLIIDAVVTYE